MCRSRGGTLEKYKWLLAIGILRNPVTDLPRVAIGPLDNHHKVRRGESIMSPQSTRTHKKQITLEDNCTKLSQPIQQLLLQFQILTFTFLGLSTASLKANTHNSHVCKLLGLLKASGVDTNYCDVHSDSIQ